MWLGATAIQVFLVFLMVLQRDNVCAYRRLHYALRS